VLIGGQVVVTLGLLGLRKLSFDANKKQLAFQEEAAGSNEQVEKRS